jgi:CRP-like cAMP-binding protein
LKADVYGPGDVIVSCGEVTTDMFFIHEGTAEVTSVTGEVHLILVSFSKWQVVATLGEGSHFGNVGLVGEKTSTTTVKAVNHCDLYVLNKGDLEKAISCFPEEKARLLELGISKLAALSLRKNIRSLLVFILKFFCFLTCKMFHKVSDAFLKDFIKAFDVKTIEGGDYLYHHDDPATEIIYFVSGRIELVNQTENVINVLEPGNSLLSALCQCLRHVSR